MKRWIKLADLPKADHNPGYWYRSKYNIQPPTQQGDPMKDKVQPAKGHVAGIVPFDDETVLMPLNAAEARRLMHSLDFQISRLRQTGDFPERDEYVNLRSNLMTALWMLIS